MFKPDDPLAPGGPVFEEAWHAQVLAIADTMINAGHFSATAWAEGLGAALKSAEAAGKPDTPETYYKSAIDALEALTDQKTPVKLPALKDRKTAWTLAYLTTPHGQPVRLRVGPDKAEF